MNGVMMSGWLSAFGDGDCGFGYTGDGAGDGKPSLDECFETGDGVASRDTFCCNPNLDPLLMACLEDVVL